MWKGRLYMRQHLLGYVIWASTSVRVFAQSANHLRLASSPVMLSYRESWNAVKRWELTSVPSLQLILKSHKSTHKERLAAHTNNQPCPVASSHSGLFWRPSLRQWRLFLLSDSTHKGLWLHNCQWASGQKYQSAHCDRSSKHLWSYRMICLTILSFNTSNFICEVFLNVNVFCLHTENLNWSFDHREHQLAKDGKDGSLFDCS